MDNKTKPLCQCGAPMQNTKYGHVCEQTLVRFEALYGYRPDQKQESKSITTERMNKHG